MPSFEPILSEESKRRSLFPLKYPHLFESYKVARAMFWTPGEVDLSSDVSHWKERLSDEEKGFLSLVLAFFSVADSIVNENLAERFSREVSIYEAKCFYNFQQAMEDIHSEMYSLLIQTYIEDEDEKERLFDSIHSFPCIRKKTEWAERWIHSSRSFGERLIAFAVVEGVFFSASFCSIFWIKQKGLMPGLSHANQLIARDEGHHQEFAVQLYKELKTKVPESVVHDIVGSAVDAEVEFCVEALKVDLIGMNSESMVEYVKFVADRLLKQLGVGKLYNARNSFTFMEQICLEGKTNFFEMRVSEYTKSGAKKESRQDFALTEDF